MRVSLLLFLLLSLAETSLSQISLVLDAPVLSATTNNPSCVNFTFNSSMGNIPILAFDEIQLNGVLAPCANTLSVWIAMAGLNDSRAYLFANPGGCTPLNGDYAFSDNAENLEMALCPGWPPEGDPAQSLPTSKYQPQGVKLPGEVCNATVIEPSSLSVFNGRPYHQMQLCAMSTADQLAPVKSTITSATLSITLFDSATPGPSSVATATATSSVSASFLAATTELSSTSVSQSTSVSTSTTTAAATSTASLAAVTGDTTTASTAAASTLAASTSIASVSATTSVSSTTEATTTSLSSATSSNAASATTSTAATEASVTTSTSAQSTSFASALAAASTARDVTTQAALITGSTATTSAEATTTVDASTLSVASTNSVADTTTTAATFAAATSTLSTTRSASLSSATTMADTTASAAQSTTTEASSTTSAALSAATVAESTAVTATASMALLDVTTTSTASTAATTSLVTTTAVRAATLGATRGASLSASSTLSLASTTSDNTPPPGEIVIEFGTVFNGDWTPPATVIIRANSTEQVGNDAVIVVNGVADLSGTTIIIELAQTPEEDARIRLVQAVQVSGVPAVVLVKAPKGENCITVYSRPDPGPTVLAVLLHPESNDCTTVDRPLLLFSVVVGGTLLTLLLFYGLAILFLSKYPDLIRFVRPSRRARTAEEGVYTRF